MESMSSFFEARVDGYDEHMLNNVLGCKEGYIEMAKLVPPSCKTLLDLGCGTGLELDEIFKKLSDIHVTGIDLTQAMLDKLKHYDTPCTIDNQIRLLKDAGFKTVEKVFRIENTTILVAYK